MSVGGGIVCEVVVAISHVVTVCHVAVASDVSTKAKFLP